MHIRSLFLSDLGQNTPAALDLPRLAEAAMSAFEKSFAMETANSPNHSPLNFAGSPINKTLSAEEKIETYRQMVRIRRFEQAALKNYQKDGTMGGFLHLYVGQESVAVGAASLMGDHDHMITAYRCHAHALAVGMNMNECMAELYGKATGCSKGKGGSMHFFAPDKNFWGGHGIVAGKANSMEFCATFAKTSSDMFVA